MNKKGFTLMELLVVIVIVAVVSVGSTISFGTIDDTSSVKERINLFKDIQRSASLYLDLDEQSTINQFIEDGKLTVPFSILATENYIDKKIEDPVTGDIIADYSRNNVEIEPYYVMLYIRRDSDNIAQSVSSCIIKKVSGDNPIGRYECVAGQDGVKGSCGDCPIN